VKLSFYLIADTRCYCGFCNAYVLTTDAALLDDIVQEIIANLTIDKKATSKAIREKISAPDDRASSKAVGVAGVLFLTFTVALMTTGDVIVFSRYAFQALQSALQKPFSPSISPNAVTHFDPDEVTFDPIYAEDLVNLQSA